MLLSIFLLSKLQTPPQRVSSVSGQLEILNWSESRFLPGSRAIRVWLPPNYSAEKSRRFSVIYMHDGQNVFDGMTSFLPNLEWRADETAEMLINAKLMEPVIIVAIDNGGTARGDEYLPTSTRLGNSVVGGKADTYGDFLDKEVMPMINAKYRTKTGAENTGLIGSSFGGVITCYLTATRPNTYGKAAIVSPSVWVDNKVLLKYVGKFNGKKPKIWIDMGTHEGPNAVAEARELYDAYLKRGFIPGKDIQFTIEPNAEHNEVAWARRLPSIYTFLFGKK